MLVALGGVAEAPPLLGSAWAVAGASGGEAAPSCAALRGGWWWAPRWARAAVSGGEGEHRPPDAVGPGGARFASGAVQLDCEGARVGWTVH